MRALTNWDGSHFESAKSTLQNTASRLSRLSPCATHCLHEHHSGPRSPKMPRLDAWPDASSNYPLQSVSHFSTMHRLLPVQNNLFLTAEFYLSRTGALFLIMTRMEIHVLSFLFPYRRRQRGQSSRDLMISSLSEHSLSHKFFSFL